MACHWEPGIPGMGRALSRRREFPEEQGIELPARCRRNRGFRAGVVYTRYTATILEIPLVNSVTRHATMQFLLGQLLRAPCESVIASSSGMKDEPTRLPHASSSKYWIARCKSSIWIPSWQCRSPLGCHVAVTDILLGETFVQNSEKTMEILILNGNNGD